MKEKEPNNDLHNEFVLRVIYSLMKPIVKLAAANQIEMSELGPWLQVAYFHALKEQGFKMRQMSSVMGLSMRKIAMLSKKLKQNFLRPEEEVELPRQIEFMLWAEPLSSARLTQGLPDASEEAVLNAIEILLAEDRIKVVSGRVPLYSISSTKRRIVGREWKGKIDGLNHVMNTVYNATYGKLLKDDERAFARTLQMHICEDDVEKLTTFYSETVFPFLVQLDADAAKSTSPIPFDVSLLWAPSDYSQENE